MIWKQIPALQCAALYASLCPFVSRFPCVICICNKCVALLLNALLDLEYKIGLQERLSVLCARDTEPYILFFFFFLILEMAIKSNSKSHFRCSNSHRCSDIPLLYAVNAFLGLATILCLKTVWLPRFDPGVTAAGFGCWSLIEASPCLLLN